MTRRACAVVALCCALLAGGCGGGDDEKSAGGPTSPVSGALRGTAGADALAPLLVSPVEPAVPFKGSNGRYLVSYELRLFNATPLASSRRG